MNLNMLPDDILHAIFRKLLGQWVIRCRSVCRRWQEAVDSLSDKDWRIICHNCSLYMDYVQVHNKYGLPWKDSYKALNSWNAVSSAKLSSQKLSDHTEYFKVLPNGIVACLQNNRHKDQIFGVSDTIVYYNTNYFKKCGEDNYETCFISESFDENEYFKVFIRVEGKLCIVLKETKQLFEVGDLCIEASIFLGLTSNCESFNLIDKEVYFRNAKDEIIYVSKLKEKEGVSTVETEPLEAFLENHDSFEEYIVAICLQKGNVHILSDEGNKGNIYIHENADFGWVSQLYYDQFDIFLELNEYGFDWKSPAIYDWLSTRSSYVRPAFYSHGNVYLTTRSYRKTICIHYFPYHIYGPEHLLKLFKGKPLRKISIQEILDDKQPYCVHKVDIIETSTNHKILALIGKKLFVLELIPSKQDKKTQKQIKIDKRAVQKKQLTAKYRTAKKKVSYTAKKKIGQKKSVQAKKKNAKREKRIPHQHRYATRSKSN